MVYGETYLGDGDHRTRSERIAAEEAELTEQVVQVILDGGMRDGGYATPCGDFEVPSQVRTHAERCAECREVVDA